MDQMLLRIFQREVERQARFGLIAKQDLEDALQSRDIDRVWYSIQSLLVAVGNISKLLWPSVPSMPMRGAKLRESLAVADESPLQPRKFRNHFEHFDERLEQWATSSARRGLADSNIGPSGMIAGLDYGDYLRNFDTNECAVTFRGDTYPLTPLVNELKQLHMNALQESRKPPWE